MNLQEAIRKNTPDKPPSVPDLRYLSAAANRVRERWPDVAAPKDERERESLARRLKEKVERDDWEGTRLSFVTAAAAAVFDPERQDRPDLARTRDFLYAEVRASGSETFLSGLLRAYLESYAPDKPHTRSLSVALTEAMPRMSRVGRRLLEDVPEILDPKDGPDRLAAKMIDMTEPFRELVDLGVRNPHGSGFMDLTHRGMTRLVRSKLKERDRIDWFVDWLRPTGREARNTGAEPAIEALVHPWLNETPSDELRSHLVETLIELYGDPRIKSGGVWAGVEAGYMTIIYRWLTREDMRFFTGVVDAAQKDAMWPPRRDFWLELFDEKKIDAAWAALSSQAFEFARQSLMRQDAKNAYTRVGHQRARHNTSLLIMKIGNKIMVDGCHSYRTHVFDQDDPMAPKLFEEGYDCEEIMRASDDRRTSDASKSHSSIPSWSRWVRDMINADVPRSNQTRPYTKVFRPRHPAPRFVPPARLAFPSYSPKPSVRAEPWKAPSHAAGPDSSPVNSQGVPLQGSAEASQHAAPPPASVAAAKRNLPRTADQGSGHPNTTASLKGKRFPSLTDRLIAYGPNGASSMMALFDEPEDGRTRPPLSPKAREGLQWLHEGRGEPPRRLRNALEHLLIALKTGGRDP